MGAYYHIEGNYYLVPDEYSWNIGKADHKTKDGEIAFRFLGYCSTPEDALKYYLKIKHTQTATEGTPGTIHDLLDKLTAETKRFTETLEKLVSLYDPEIPEVLKELDP